MHRLYLFLFVIVFAASTAYGQQLTESEKAAPTEEKIPKVDHPASNTLKHIFLCQRCGSENILNWGFPSENEGIELIPHCNFCGKKYWPKFKPSGMLERTYCSSETIEQSEDVQHAHVRPISL